MISQSKIQRIKQLLKQGLSQRRVAALLRVGRNQISDIAHGRRPNYSGQRKKSVGGKIAIAASRKYVRCLQCGGMVRMPCAYCHVRQRSNQRATRDRGRE